MATVLIVSLLICFSYIVFVYARFNVSSISESYYHFEKQKKGKGMLFWAWSVLTSLSLIPCWLEVSSDRFQFVAFLSAVALAAVGCFPDYKGEHKTAHPLFTAMSAALAVLWGILAGIWYIPVGGIALACILIFLINKKTLKEYRNNGWYNALYRIKLLFWMEVAAFVSIYMSVWVV